MPAVVTVVATVEKGCGCCGSAQMGQRVVFAWSGDGKLQQKWGTLRKKPIYAQVNGVASEEEGSCRPGPSEIIPAAPKTSTPLGIPVFPDISVQSCSSC